MVRQDFERVSVSLLPEVNGDVCSLSRQLSNPPPEAPALGDITPSMLIGHILRETALRKILLGLQGKRTGPYKACAMAHCVESGLGPTISHRMIQLPKAQVAMIDAITVELKKHEPGVTPGKVVSHLVSKTIALRLNSPDKWTLMATRKAVLRSSTSLPPQA